MQCIYQVVKSDTKPVGELVRVDFDSGIIYHYADGTVAGKWTEVRRGTAMPDRVAPALLESDWGSELKFHSMVPAALQSGVPHDGKDDSGKTDPSLLYGGCALALAEVSKVLDAGAKKYAADSWQQVPDGINRYRKAFYRHLQAVGLEGWESVNTADGAQLHIDHMITDLLFIRTLMLKEKQNAPK